MSFYIWLHGSLASGCFRGLSPKKKYSVQIFFGFILDEQNKRDL